MSRVPSLAADGPPALRGIGRTATMRAVADGRGKVERASARTRLRAPRLLSTRDRAGGRAVPSLPSCLALSPSPSRAVPLAPPSRQQP
eukprot:scaffold200394_cov32-Tisochrysis_lutea.AAC.1